MLLVPGKQKADQASFGLGRSGDVRRECLRHLRLFTHSQMTICPFPPPASYVVFHSNKSNSACRMWWRRFQWWRQWLVPFKTVVSPSSGRQGVLQEISETFESLAEMIYFSPFTLILYCCLFWWKGSLGRTIPISFTNNCKSLNYVMQKHNIMFIYHLSLIKLKAGYHQCSWGLGLRLPYTFML